MQASDCKINKYLLPFAWLYGLGVGFRNKLFDWKILPSEEFPVPVISIGNLTVGGTGKTPHTEYLIRLLSKNYRIAVLSRGYKRKSKGFVLADKSASAQTIGDEPFQMYRKFPEISVAVDGNRRRGIRNLLSLPDKQKPAVILLDDAYQHRYVKPSLSILLTDSKRLFFEDCLLPAGRLREPAKNHSRADIILVTKCENIRSEHPALNDAFYTSYRYGELLPVFSENALLEKDNVERLQKESYSFLTVTGLANPSGLINYLKKYSDDLHSLIYPDHHDFSRKNMAEIAATFHRIHNKHKIIITSEKDAARLSANPYVSETIKPFLFYLPIEVVFYCNTEELFTQKIEDHVKKFTRNPIMA